MANAARTLGANVFTLMKKAGISCKDLASSLNYSERDVCRIIEGKLMMTPADFAKIAEILKTTKSNLLHYQSNYPVPELQYMKKFENPDNLDRILDLLDEYVELKEAE